MKYLLPFILLLGIQFARAQSVNHVPNPSFEQKISCPTAISQAYVCSSWRAFNYGSSDYFNTCASNAAGVPINIGGYQFPALGNAYMGIINYSKVGSTVIDYKEYIAAPITPLQTGAVYSVSMSVSWADSAGWAVNDLGAFFYDQGPDTVYANGVLGVTPQVSYSSAGNIPIAEPPKYTGTEKKFSL